MTVTLTEKSLIRFSGWLKANSFPVCFGARHNVFGKFHLPSSGKLAAIKLVHLYGYVSCAAPKPYHWSYWGCGHVNKNDINVVITDTHNRIILPPNQLITSGSHAAGKWYNDLGYSSVSPELVLSVFSHPPQVSSGQEFRVWYGEDLVNWTEHDNDGKVCIDVYALYV